MALLAYYRAQDRPQAAAGGAGALDTRVVKGGTATGRSFFFGGGRG